MENNNFNNVKNARLGPKKYPEVVVGVLISDQALKLPLNSYTKTTILEYRKRF